MYEKPKLLAMIGIAGSGKSTIAKELMGDRDDIVYLSSDELIGEEVMINKIVEVLKEGKHIIYDDTNISRKKRKGLLQQLPKDVMKVAVYASTEYRHIVEQNNNRDRVVPQHVIDRMYKTMQVPIYSEGWDKIVFSHHDLTTENKYDKAFTDAIRAEALFNRDGYGIMNFLASYFEEFFGVYDLAQDSMWHNFSVSRHIYYVYRHVLEKYETEDQTEKEVMLWTALCHDIGKHFCKSFINRKGEEARYANFIGHEKTSSQMTISFLHKMNFDDDFIYKVSTLVQFHMDLLQIGDNEKAKNKLREKVGDDMFEKLEFLKIADESAK